MPHSRRSPAPVHRSIIIGSDAVRVGIATARDLVRIALVTILGEISPQTDCRIATDANAALDLVKSFRPRVLFLDEAIADQIPALHHSLGKLRVVVISRRMHPGTQPPFDPLAVCSFIGDLDDETSIRSAIRFILSCAVSGSGCNQTCATCMLRASLRPPRLSLSPREYQIFEYIGLGHSNQQIATELSRSVKTIEAHRENIKQKLDLDSTTTLAEAAFAWRRGDCTPALLRASGDDRHRPGNSMNTRLSHLRMKMRRTDD